MLNAFKKGLFYGFGYVCGKNVIEEAKKALENMQKPPSTPKQK